jgi:hypothetical protein
MRQRSIILPFSAFVSSIGLTCVVAAQADMRLPLTTNQPRRPTRNAELPLPPAQVGCHVFHDGTWSEIPCATEEEMKRLPPPAALAIQDQQRWVPLFRRNLPYTLPMQLGAIQIELESDPAIGKVVDVAPPNAICGTTTTVASENSFGIQLNTNTFTTDYGNQGWVQFTYQTVPSNVENLCVWKIDTTLGQKINYESVCTNVKSSRTFLGPAAAGTAGQIAEVLGVIRKSTDNGPALLTAWMQIPWGESFSYAVTTPDTITGKARGLSDSQQHPFGLSGRWTQVSGDIYGVGCGSRAEFSGTRVFERLWASTCVTFPYDCGGPVGQFSLSNFALPIPDPDITGESNNLMS